MLLLLLLLLDTSPKCPAEMELRGDGLVIGGGGVVVLKAVDIDVQDLSDRCKVLEGGDDADSLDRRRGRRGVGGRSKMEEAMASDDCPPPPGE